MALFSRSPSYIRTVILLGFLAVFVQFAAIRPAVAALSCNPQSQYGTTIGLEWVAKQCIPEGMNYGTSIYYENNALECQGSTVGLFAWYGDTQGSPASIANYYAANGYRVFLNREGSHIVAVHSNYTGIIPLCQDSCRLSVREKC